MREGCSPHRQQTQLRVKRVVSLAEGRMMFFKTSQMGKKGE